MNFVICFSRGVNAIYMNNVPIQIDVLDTKFILYSELESRYNKLWKLNSLYPETSVRRFVYANRKSFDFLGVNVEMTSSAALHFTSTKFCGAAQLFSPVTGKPMCLLEVRGRYSDSFSSFLTTGSAQDLLQFEESIPIYHSSRIKPPFFHLCSTFLHAFRAFNFQAWRKFSTHEVIAGEPSSGTIWEKYIVKSTDPRNALRFPNKQNYLSPHHHEYKSLLYAVKMAMDALLAPDTPPSYKCKLYEVFPYCDKLLKEICVQPVSSIHISRADSPNIANIKRLANSVLNCTQNSHFSWRFDCAKVYERYVQKLFSDYADRYSARFLANPKHAISGTRAISWGISHLEPDMVVFHRDRTIVIDAKYKSHMLNIGSLSKELKEVFRSDLHQILAYCSLYSHTKTTAMLIYPLSTGLTWRRLHFSAADIDVFLIGISVNTLENHESCDDFYKLIFKLTFHPEHISL